AEDRSSCRRLGRTLPRPDRRACRLMRLLRTSDADFERQFARVVEDRREIDTDIAGTVADILAAVRARGDVALAEYTVRFDKPALHGDDGWRIGAEACHAAFAALEPELRKALELSAARIRAYHADQLPKDRDFVD